LGADTGQTPAPKYNIDDCEGPSDLLARIRSSGVRAVRVERADRLARDLIVDHLIGHQVFCAIFRDSGVVSMPAYGATPIYPQG
jgi:hypothetical protein